MQTLRSLSAFLTVTLVATLLTSCGAKDTHEKIMEDTLALMEKVVATMEGVTDKESAEAAASKLEGMVGDFENVAERIEAIGEPDEATKKELDEKYNKRGEEMVQKMMSSVLAVATKDPSIMKTLQEPMEKIGEVMEKVR